MRRLVKKRGRIKTAKREWTELRLEEITKGLETKKGVRGGQRSPRAQGVTI
jgi:hypothetical protein